MLRLMWLTVAVAGLAAAPAAAAPVATFHPCTDAPATARCGSVQVPLDRRGENPAADPRTLQIEFELYARRRDNRPSLGTMVDAEGGPGYSTTDSRDYYLELQDPLMDRRDLLLVDQRGTGLSGPLDCPAFQATVEDYVRRAGDCAQQLGGRVDFYGTHAAVDDLADVLDALGIGAIDLYGDSYGSYLAQAFAVRHPRPHALAGARRDLPAARHRPRVRRSGRGDAPRAAARVRPAAELRRERRGSGRGAAAAGRPRAPRPDQRDGDDGGRRADPGPRR